MLALGTKGDTLGDARLDVVLGQIVTLAPTRLTIVHLEHLEHFLILLGALFFHGEDEVILVRRNGVSPLRDIMCKNGASTRLRIDLVERTMFALLLVNQASD